ncbi:MAG: reverse transcriptase domain-containing protein [Planctomycetota bacterium]
MSVIEHGYRIPFKGDPCEMPRYHAHRNGEGGTTYEPWLRDTLPELIAVGAVEPVTKRPHIVALVDVIPKSTAGKFRLIVDLRPLNKHVLEREFSYETHATFRDLLEENDGMITIDLSSGYHHVDIHPAHRTYLGFKLFGRYYVYAVLPFGLRDACFQFTEVMKVPVRHLRSLGLRVLPYLDDFLVCLQGMTQSDANRVLSILVELGLLINFEKSVLSPTSRAESLGFVVDTTEMTYELTPKRHAKFTAVATALATEVARSGSAPARDIARVTGHVASAALVLERRGKLHTRFLNDAIRDAAAARRWSDVVPMGAGAAREIAHWLEILPTLEPTPIRRPQRPPATVTISSDASDFAWGGLVLASAPGAFPQTEPLPVARGLFTDVEAGRSSAWRELRAARRTLESVVAAGCRHQVVCHRLDSQAAHHVVSNAGSQNRGPDGELDLHLEVLGLDETAADAHLEYYTEWVPREQNQEADDASKLRDCSNYRLSRGLFVDLERRFGQHDADRFADANNRLLPRFNSRFLTPDAEAVDAFTVSWAGGVNWLHPPLAVISRVVGKLRRDQARGTLVVPRWPGAPWWPALFPPTGGPVVEVFTIPAARDTFIAGESAARLGHGDAPPWTMLALKVDFARRH